MSRNNSASNYMDRLKQITLAQTYVQPQQPRPVPLDSSVLLNTRVGQQPKTVIRATPIEGSCQVYNLPTSDPGCCGPCTLGPFLGADYFEVSPIGTPPPDYFQYYGVTFSEVENATSYTLTTTNSDAVIFFIGSAEFLPEGTEAFEIYLPTLGDTPGTVTITATNGACSVSIDAEFQEGGFIPLVAHSSSMNEKLRSAFRLKWTE